jgi:hypothetical protein
MFSVGRKTDSGISQTIEGEEEDEISEQCVYQSHWHIGDPDGPGSDHPGRK